MSQKKVFIALYIKESVLLELVPELLAYNDIKEVKIYGNGVQIYYESTNRQEWEVIAALERVLGRKGFPVHLTEDY